MLPLLLTAALLAPADTDPVVVPKGAAPALRVGQIDKAGHFVTEVTVMQAVPVAETVTVNVNGKLETRTVTKYVYQTKVVSQTIDISKATATTAAGKKLDKKDLAKRLEKKAVVIFSTDGKPVDKGYLAVFKADTVVLVVPPPPVPMEKKAATGAAVIFDR